jgi:hypothetical protein
MSRLWRFANLRATNDAISVWQIDVPIMQVLMTTVLDVVAVIVFFTIQIRGDVTI